MRRTLEAYLTEWAQSNERDHIVRCDMVGGELVIAVRPYDGDDIVHFVVHGNELFPTDKKVIES